MGKRRKIIVVLFVLFLAVGLTASGVFLYRKIMCRLIDKPAIVEHFACSDYCPGSPEQYLVRIYQGVEDEEECRRLCGRPFTYYGWKAYHICIVE